MIEDTKKCVRCSRTKDISHFDINKRTGKPCKTCNECRHIKKLEAERRKKQPKIIEAECSFCGTWFTYTQKQGKPRVYCKDPDCRLKRKAYTQRRLYQEKKGTVMECETCDNLEECNLRVQVFKIPHLCEMEVWPVDRYYLEQLPFELVIQPKELV